MTASAASWRLGESAVFPHEKRHVRVQFEHAELAHGRDRERIDVGIDVCGRVDRY
jgi:hypothetical protein